MAFTYRDMGDMGCMFHKYILRILRNGQLDCKDATYAVLCLYSCVTVMDRTKLSIKSTGLWVFQKLIPEAHANHSFF